MKKIIIFITGLLCAFALASPVSAHVVVRPAEVGVGARQVFTVSVPNEKETSTIAVRLLIPEVIKSVTPNVKPGWTIEVNEDESGSPTEIIWTGGNIPVGQRDEFMFGTQAPAEPTTLVWKAYQVYTDGVVAWDLDPATIQSHEGEEEDPFNPGPYSMTSIIDDLSSPPENNLSGSSISLVLSILALIISLFALKKSKRSSQLT